MFRMDFCFHCVCKRLHMAQTDLNANHVAHIASGVTISMLMVVSTACNLSDSQAMRSDRSFTSSFVLEFI